VGGRGAWKRLSGGVYRGECPLPQRSLGELLRRFGAQVVVGHPTLRNEDNIAAELSRGMAAAAEVYRGRRVAFVVSDGTFRLDDPDESTVAAALRGAGETLRRLPPQRREDLLVAAVPYDGYGGDRTPGKGSALKLLYEELAFCPSLQVLLLLDGDLRNELAPWFAVYRRLEEAHRSAHPGEEFFVTARYARHFVDASLTRFVVGPLTTLMGQYVPGGISGDIALSAGAVEHERQADWDESRRRYGTDIATTFDNIADGRTRIYEVYLGAKLHDITDEAKLSVMPGEVIAAALGRLLHYESLDGRVSSLLRSDSPVRRPDRWGPERTGIAFIDPGYTDVFDPDRKRTALIERFGQHREAMQRVLTPRSFAFVSAAYEGLRDAGAEEGAPLRFLGVTRERWIEMLYQSLGFLLRGGEPQTAKSCLNYLYTAAFLEFCREKLFSLGAGTLGQARRLRNALGVPAERAEAFYGEEVDAVVEKMALQFHAGRRAILEA
jgi:hypothetical protein